MSTPKLLPCLTTCAACQALEPPMTPTIVTIAQIKSPVTDDEDLHANNANNVMANSPAKSRLSVQINFMFLFYQIKNGPSACFAYKRAAFG